MTLLEAFIQAGRAMTKPVVVEMGTCRSNPAISTQHAVWFPDAGAYVGTDFQPGLDVDLVADAHRFSESFGPESIDILISCSVFEHLKYPFLAAHEILKTLKVGGLLFLQTHQSFPLHAFPSDYFRYSREGLAGLFGTRNGFRVLLTTHEFPASIQSVRDPRTADGPAFLNTCLYGQKFAPTPEVYHFDLDTPDPKRLERCPATLHPAAGRASGSVAHAT